MTTNEFSDMFDTLLNSYANKALFGDQASNADIALDEYEKSVILTQALDIIVKSYFDRTLNNQGLGFDDSARRQVDFSSLIKVDTINAEADTGEAFDNRGIIFKLPCKQDDTNTTTVLFILNEKLLVGDPPTIIPAYWYKDGEDNVEGAYSDEVAIALPTSDQWAQEHDSNPYTSVSDAESDGWSWLDTQVIYGDSKDYTIVPINYREYDREMSKAYAQPLKKQAWRLFQNAGTGFDVLSEIIPIFNLKDSYDEGKMSFRYKIRYVRRPQPIIVTKLPDGLSVDGESEVSQCELNPILHVDILNKAVEIALATRGHSPNRVRDTDNKS